MSRFTRPQFTAPKVPKPPKAFAQFLPVLAIVQGLLPVVAQVQSIGVTGFVTRLAMNAALAQLATQKAALQQRLLKLEILNKARKQLERIPIPPALQVDPREALAYAREVQALAADPRAALEGQVRSAVNEFGESAKSQVQSSLA